MRHEDISGLSITAVDGKTVYSNETRIEQQAVDCRAEFWSSSHSQGPPTKDRFALNDLEQFVYAMERFGEGELEGLFAWEETLYRETLTHSVLSKCWQEVEYQHFLYYLSTERPDDAWGRLGDVDEKSTQVLDLYDMDWRDPDHRKEYDRLRYVKKKMNKLHLIEEDEAAEEEDALHALPKSKSEPVKEKIRNAKGLAGGGKSRKSPASVSRKKTP